MARLPDKRQLQSQLMGLELKERRAIVRAVNRGRAVEKKAHAPLAVGVARRQQRFWKVAWILGPLIGGIQLLFSDVEAAVANTIIGTVALGMMSAFWFWRAKRSEERNLTLVEGRRGRRPSAPTQRETTSEPTPWWRRFSRSKASEPLPEFRPAPRRGHLPGERPTGSGHSRTGTTSPNPVSGMDGQRSAEKGPKPPAPRGKKRRR